MVRMSSWSSTTITLIILCSIPAEELVKGGVTPPQYCALGDNDHHQHQSRMSSSAARQHFAAVPSSQGHAVSSSCGTGSVKLSLIFNLAPLVGGHALRVMVFPWTVPDLVDTRS